ncbi:Rho-binding antiterminator [Pseudomonas sp. NPDC089530]|uniref:Rho-binding antiterminator n=1 Tax=Pseudomonas sp. NPDC089530 TaxID=3390651 RepID=UPI003D07FA51
MNTYRPLDCDLHDYLEIACMHGYRLLVERVDGSRFEAYGTTTRTHAGGEEFFCLEGAEGPLEVRLDQLLAITPLDANRSFGRILLNGQPCAI